MMMNRLLDCCTCCCCCCSPRGATDEEIERELVQHKIDLDRLTIKRERDKAGYDLAIYVRNAKRERLVNNNNTSDKLDTLVQQILQPNSKRTSVLQHVRQQSAQRQQQSAQRQSPPPPREGVAQQQPAKRPKKRLYKRIHPQRQQQQQQPDDQLQRHDNETRILKQEYEEEQAKMDIETHRLTRLIHAIQIKQNIE